MLLQKYNNTIEPSPCVSVGIVNGVNAKENYAKHFLDIGAGAIYGFDYCWWPNGASAYSFTIGTSYGVYGGYDYYWCLD